jgi:hypothetical protein
MFRVNNFLGSLSLINIASKPHSSSSVFMPLLSPARSPHSGCLQAGS